MCVCVCVRVCVRVCVNGSSGLIILTVLQYYNNIQFEHIKTIALNIQKKMREAIHK